MLGARPESPNKNASAHGPFHMHVLDFLRGGWILNRTSFFIKKCCEGIVEDAKHAAQPRTLRLIINDIAASPEMTQSGIDYPSARRL
jgi:hypothetical protein